MRVVHVRLVWRATCIKDLSTYTIPCHQGEAPPAVGTATGRHLLARRTRVGTECPGSFLRQTCLDTLNDGAAAY